MYPRVLHPLTAGGGFGNPVDNETRCTLTGIGWTAFEKLCPPGALTEGRIIGIGLPGNKALAISLDAFVRFRNLRFVDLQQCEGITGARRAALKVNMRPALIRIA